MKKLKPKELRLSDPTPADLAQIKRNPISFVLDEIYDTYNVGSLVSLAGGPTPITWTCGSDCISWAALVFWTGSDAP